MSAISNLHMEIDPKFKKPYNPADVEDAVYQRWESSGYFDPDHCVADGITSADAEPFSMILPPPNVTGSLHMGHAAMISLQDILVRYRRMQGRRTLWLPGTDHAAIATASKVESKMYEEDGLTRHDVGWEAFIERAEAFAQDSHDTIVNQLRKMGASLDWDREAYTLDEQRNRAVRAAFVRMYNAGLIYRGKRIVNWDPKMQTTVSDDEIERKETKDTFYYFQYGPFEIGTARPETKFGDKYVVMHPDDDRYSEYEHGQQITVEWINGTITATIIKDEAADMEFGTGVMTITPWHDATDFDIAQRHSLEKEQIIDWDGTLTEAAGEFAGMHIDTARPKIVEKMREKGLLLREDHDYVHNLALNERGKGVIEPQIKEQWFVAVNTPFTLENPSIGSLRAQQSVTFKELMRHAVDSDHIRIIPERFEKIYHHWIDNLGPWCISRQIWYGHRVPVWYRTNEGGEYETYVGVEAPDGDEWEQDPDTLDTWFSSGLWTFSTMGWPEETDDLATYHPTNVLETGYDILFFWVARMILMTGFLREEVPFSHVYLHGIVRDEDGKKMSKSLGNVLDPLDMISEYGADATRFSLVVGTAPGNDISISEDKIRGYKHFTNKIWNASRFVLSNIEQHHIDTKPELTAVDRQALEELDELCREVTQQLEDFKLYLAGERLYHYFWHTFADVIIERSKEALYGDDEAARHSAAYTLYQILTTNLKLLHPFMPYVTEEIWSHFPHADTDMLMVASWPQTRES
jgi:valyl-tRNA synthetase